MVLDSGAQFLLTEHYTQKPPYLAISGQVGTGTPAELCERFAAGLGISVSDFLWISEDWPPTYPLRSS